MIYPNAHDSFPLVSLFGGGGTRDSVLRWLLHAVEFVVDRLPVFVGGARLLWTFASCPFRGFVIDMLGKANCPKENACGDEGCEKGSYFFHNGSMNGKLINYV